MQSSESRSEFESKPDQVRDNHGFSNQNRIVSLLGNDPDLMDLVDDFVAAMPDRITSIRAAIDAQDVSTLQRLMHQLKGACGSYGFPQLTNEAAILEKMLCHGVELRDIERPLVDFIQKLSQVASR